MLPRKVLSSSAALVGTELVPRYLGERDYPWLRELIERYRGCVGRARRELRAELARPLPSRSPRNKLRIAAHALQALSRDEALAGVEPALLRRALFSAASARDRSRDVLVAEVGAELGLEPVVLERQLFADLPGERLLAEPALVLSPPSLAQEANFAVASGFVKRAGRLTIDAWGDTRALVRHAHLAGLICSVSEPEPDAVRLDVSGPFALFRHTHVYGRALASFIPRLTWCSRFELVAECPLRGSSSGVTFRLKSGDPIGVARALPARDERLEARFVRDFARATSDWELVREPVPVRVGERLVSADFAIVSRVHPERQALLEIVGYWTPDYLTRKLTDAEGAGLPPSLLCVDESKACGGDLPRDPRLVAFRRRIDARAVLASLAQVLVETPP